MDFNSLIVYADIFILVLTRIAALFVISPIFGRKNLPAMYKIAFAALIAFVLFPSVTPPEISSYSNIFAFALLMLQEFAIGILLGFVSYISFASFYIAGQIIDMQMGFGMVNILDPVSNIQIPIIANFLNIIGMVFFLAINGHHILISSLAYSYKVLPIGQAVIKEALFNDFVRIFVDLFAIGFKISAPVLVCILISEVALGLLAKTAPQMNVFMLGMPLKILIGFFILIFMMPIFISFVEFLVGYMSNGMESILKDMIK